MKDFKKTILIVSATRDGFTSASSFLVHQGWEVKVTDDLREALGHLAKEQPEVLLVCMDHPNRNIYNLPKLVSERFRCCVIVTTQKSTLESYRLLQQAFCEYKIFPPGSGPAIERTVGKYLNKMRNLVQEPPVPDRKHRGNSTGTIQIKDSASIPVIDYSHWNRPRRNNVVPVKVPVENSADLVLMKGTEKVIKDIIEVADNVPRTPLELNVVRATTQLTCFFLECEKFQGYLVAALGKDSYLDEGFSKLIQKHLMEYLEEQGEKISHSDLLQVQIKKVEFLDWAVDYSNFLLKSIHKGNEIAFAFFPVQEKFGGYAASASQDMLSVPIKELHADTKVNCNLYIHFPANNKYVLYTLKDSILYRHQQERLSSRGVERLHIRKEDLRAMNQYRAQRYFNSIIDEFNALGALPA